MNVSAIVAVEEILFEDVFNWGSRKLLWLKQFSETLSIITPTLLQWAVWPPDLHPDVGAHVEVEVDTPVQGVGGASWRPGGEGEHRHHQRQAAVA